jgi:hypothetical protein
LLMSSPAKTPGYTSIPRITAGIIKIPHGVSVGK